MLAMSVPLGVNSRNKPFVLKKGTRFLSLCGIELF